MRLLIDLQACQTPGSCNRGIGRYSMSLCQAMIKQMYERNHEVIIFLNAQFPESVVSLRKTFKDLIPQEKIIVFDSLSPVAELSSSNEWRARAAEQIREYTINSINPDILHVSSLFEGLDSHAVTSIHSFHKNPPTASTLYDLIPLMCSDIYLKNKQVKQWYYKKIESLKKADLLLSISENSRKEAINYLGIDSSRIINISSAIDPCFKPISISELQKQEITQKYNIDRPFIMYTGGIDYRKNIDGLIQAYANLPHEIRQKYQLAIVCSIKEDEKNQIFKIARKSKLNQQDLILTGYVSDDELIALYNLCELFVFPSLYEGFGLPALEAMSCGAPVIGSNNSSIPEVIGRQDALFNPHKVEEITQSMYSVLTDLAFQESLRESGRSQSAKFSWSQSAHLALDAFERLYAEKQKTQNLSLFSSSSKPSLAYFSPLPPEPSGISDYSTELLSYLQKYYQITLISSSVNINDASLSLKLPVNTIEWFQNNAENFERVLYHFGGSEFHQQMFELLQDHPGIVVLHDFYLSGMIYHIDNVKMALGSIFCRELYDSHGYPSLLDYKNKKHEDVIMQYPCNLKIINNAKGVIVHSRHSLNLANHWYGDNASKDWYLIPHLESLPSKFDKNQEKENLGFKSSDFILCCFGRVSPTKLNHRLLTAWLNSSLAQSDNSYLVFVGSNPSGKYERALKKMIRQSGKSKQIYITDFVTSELYQKYLSIADISVQLRTLSRGETSGALLDVMAYGIPVVINAHGSMDEYPHDVCIKLPNDFDNKDLIQAMEKLYQEQSFREQLSTLEREYILEKHSPNLIAEEYFKAIEFSYQKNPHSNYQHLLESLKSVQSITSPLDSDLIMAAEVIAVNSPPLLHKQLFIDITDLLSYENLIADAGYAFIYALLSQFLKAPLKNNYRVEPIYWDGRVYRYAQTFTQKLLKIKEFTYYDDVIDFSREDCLLSFQVSTNSGNQLTLEKFNRLGIKISAVIFEHIAQQDLFKLWIEKNSCFLSNLLIISPHSSRFISEVISENLIDNQKTCMISLDNSFENSNFTLLEEIKSEIIKKVFDIKN